MLTKFRKYADHFKSALNNYSIISNHRRENFYAEDEVGDSDDVKRAKLDIQNDIINATEQALQIAVLAEDQQNKVQSTIASGTINNISSFMELKGVTDYVSLVELSDSIATTYNRMKDGDVKSSIPKLFKYI